MRATACLGFAIAALGVLTSAGRGDVVLLYDFASKPDARAADLSGQANHGRIANGGWGGAGLCFNGRDTTVTAPSSPSLRVKRELTVEAWVHFTENPGHEAYILAKDGCYTDGYGFALDRGARVRFKLDGKNRSLVTREPLKLNEWNHLAGTFSLARGEMAFFLDGELQGMSPSDVELVTSDKPFVIGNRWNRQYNEHFRGCVRRVRVRNRALTAEEVKGVVSAERKTLATPSQPTPILETFLPTPAGAEPPPPSARTGPSMAFPVQGGRAHRLSFRFRARGAGGRIGFRSVPLADLEGELAGVCLEQYPIDATQATGDWQEHSEVLYVNVDTRLLAVALLASEADGEIEFGKPSLTPVDARELTIPPRLSDFPVDYAWERFPCPPHPRLYFTAADWERLRRESREAPKAAIWETVRAEIDESLRDNAPDSYEDPWEYPGYEDPKWRKMFSALYSDSFTRGLRYCETNAFAYRITGDRKYLENAKKWMLRPCRWEHWCLLKDGRYVWSSYDLCVTHKMQGLATAYDWLYSELSEAERKLVRDTLAKWSEVSFEHMRVGGWVGMGNHLGPQLAGQAIAAIALLGEHPDAAKWLNQCIWQMKFHALRPPYMGRDAGLVTGYRFTSYIMTYLTSVAHAVKTLTGMQLLNRSLIDWPLYGLIPPDKMVDLESSSYDKPYYYLRAYVMKLASDFRDSHAQWWVNSSPRPCGRGAASRGNLWAFVYFDPTVAPEFPESRPSSKHFRDIGWVYMRSGWGPEDAYFALKSGPQDEKFFRNQNHIMLTAFGERLIEIPQVRRDRKYPTEANSTILVNGQGQRLGNTYRERAGESPALGRIAASFLSDAFDFAAGDASLSYERDGKTLRRFLRNVAFVKPRFLVMFDDLEGFDDAPAEFESLLRFGGRVQAETDSTILSGGKAKLLTRVLLPRDVRFLQRGAAAPDSKLGLCPRSDAEGGAEIAAQGPDGGLCIVAHHTNRWGWLELNVPLNACESREKSSTARLRCRARTTGAVRFVFECSVDGAAKNWHSPKLVSPDAWQKFEFGIPLPPGGTPSALKLSVMSGEGQDRLLVADLSLADESGAELVVRGPLQETGRLPEVLPTGEIARTRFAFAPREKRNREAFLTVFQPLASSAAPRPAIRLAEGSVPGAVVERPEGTEIVAFPYGATGRAESLQSDGRCAYVSLSPSGETLAFAGVEATLLAVDDATLARSSVPASFSARLDERGAAVRIEAAEQTALSLRLPPDAKAVWLDDKRIEPGDLALDDAGLTRFGIGPGPHNLRIER